MRGRVGEAECGDVQPSEVGAFHVRGADGAEVRDSKFEAGAVRDEKGVLVVEPGGVVEGGGEGGVGEWRDVGCHAFDGGGEPFAEAIVGDYRHGAAEAGEVVCLGGGEEGDRAFGDVVVQAGDGDVAAVGVQHDRAVDFVAHERGVVGDYQFREAGEFVAFVDAPGWIVRIAEQHHRRLPRDAGCQIVEVHRPAVIAAEHQRRDLPPQTGSHGHVEERRIGGRQHHQIRRRTGQHLRREIERRHDAGDPHQPLFAHDPVVASRKPGDERLHRRGRRGGVAEDRMLQAFADRVDHERRNWQVHVRDPERQHVAPGVALPFLRRRAATVYRRFAREPGGSGGDVSSLGNAASLRRRDARTRCAAWLSWVARILTHKGAHPATLRSNAQPPRPP